MGITGARRYAAGAMKHRLGVCAVAVVTAAIAGCKADPSGGSPSPESLAPVAVTFLDLTGEPTMLPVLPCHDQILTVISGEGATDDDKLMPGDVLITHGMTTVHVTGPGTAWTANVKLNTCDPAVSKHVVRADAAPELTFMHGAMHAHLDLDPSVSPGAYFGRLSGTAAVAEHVHAGTWEVLCTVKARGTFTLAGNPRRLGVRECVTVPPDAKHSWQPDEGEPLVALQVYWPPGPEQRFKKLAADELAGDH
jgi:mannose-6-phosphate isomerase-like protein (cupin superfamily)